ncbi:nucleotidyl transferase AbiEii/AbiGii toxin family protein [Amycolatopsis sp. OK19-0408]|uniref:Nucleotidyl transferase AbiEii/AbiGii toxin family protein n=1 Tax=Amycolatopsis iheyensis TaxID=2945988 RepID=A0A9X2N6Q6_9PSEU|nr:nucleotidyl transferase AbiEii/AbiGii toxin family protein [Amycolatopsis iheyensis]MCR6481536.1 nucleotidyl transferase AbiEii/AbiGii toxin family protein [Amycolatopsis iheyensis]
MKPKPPSSSPAAYKASVNALARQESGRCGTPVGELVELHYHRRLLARVFAAEGESWVLKGGQSLLVRWPNSRHSTDIDLISRQNTIDAAVDSLITAVSVDLDDPYDPLVYHHTRTDKVPDMDRPTRKVYFEARIGLTRLARTSVDVVTEGVRPRGSVVVEPLPAAFPSGCTTWPEIRVYPLEDVVSDKICALYTGYGADGAGTSTRYKDLVDLVLVAVKSALPAELTHRFVHLEAERRRNEGTPVRFPDRFRVPAGDWPRGYARAAAGVGALPADLRTLDGAHGLADAFISPLLQPSSPAGAWRIGERVWR